MSIYVTIIGSVAIAFGLGGIFIAARELRDGGRRRFEAWRRTYEKRGTGYDKHTRSLWLLTYTDILAMAVCAMCLVAMGAFVIFATLCG